MTQFEQAQEQVKQGTLNTPSVSVGAKAVDYFGYQLLVHIYNLKIMGAGIKFVFNLAMWRIKEAKTFSL